MADQVTHITGEGYAEFEEELEYLKTVRRDKVAERLRQALAEGGELGENAEYEDAKNEQAFVEGRIMQVEQILGSAEIIDATSAGTDEVALGSTVTVREDDRKAEKYYMVGKVEANPREGRISNESPLGQALLGSKVGDMVTVDAPDGAFTFKVVKIE